MLEKVDTLFLLVLLPLLPREGGREGGREGAEWRNSSGSIRFMLLSKARGGSREGREGGREGRREGGKEVA